MKMKKFVSLCLSLVMAMSLLSGCGGEEPAPAPEAEKEPTQSEETAQPSGAPEVTWIASCANTEDHPAVQGVMKFAELVEEKSSGRMHIDVFHSAQLASDRDCIEGMQMNTIQSGIMVASALASFTDAFLAFDLPFLFENSEQGQKLCDSQVGIDMLAKLDDVGIKGLGFMEYGMRNITNSKLPITAPADMKGIKIRTMENPIHMEAFSAMGADPTPMAFGELFTALQQGTVDGQENPLGIITGNKFEEVEKYCTLTEHVYTPYYVVMNMDKWNSLTPEQQDALTRAMEETTAYQYELSQQYEDEATSVMEEAGCAVRTLSDQEKLSFKEAADQANSFDAAKELMYRPELADQMAAELDSYRQ